MVYTKEVENMCKIARVSHGPSPIPEEGKWVQAKEIKDISGLTHGVGWCAPQQGACKLTLNIKNGIIEEALIETIGCSGMTQSAAMAGEILVGKTAFSADGLSVGAGLEDLGSTKRSQIGTVYSTKAKGPRYLELTEGYVVEVGLDSNDEIIGYKYVNIGKMMNGIKKGIDASKAIEEATGIYGRFDEAVKIIDPREE